MLFAIIILRNSLPRARRRFGILPSIAFPCYRTRIRSVDSLIHFCFDLSHFLPFLLALLDLARIPLEVSTSVALSFRFSKLVALSSTLVPLSFMSTEDRRSIPDSSKDHQGCRGDASAQPFRQKRFVNGGDANDADVHDGFSHFLLRPPPSGSSSDAPVTMASYINKLCLFLNAPRFPAMHQDGNRLAFVDARFTARDDIALGAWKKHSLLFSRNGATFLGSSEALRDIPDIRYPEERAFVARLSTLVVLRKSVRCFSDQVDVYRFLIWLYDVLLFLESLGLWGRDCNFQS